jgi:SAM-dependent methyltransferase
LPDSADAIAYENRFGPAVDAFRAFRPGYPRDLFEVILREVPEHRRERAVDLGSGTGLSALPLCQWFREVVAIEPDPQMAAELESRGASKQGGENARLTVCNTMAEDCELPAASADLVTSGTAFHWMDGPRVLARVREWLRPGGVLAVYSYPVPRLADAVEAVVQREFELHWDQYRHPRLNDENYAGRTFFTHSGLSDLRALKISNVVHFSPEEAVGFSRSTSYGSAYIRTLTDPEPYLQELLAAFRKASGGAPIAADFGLSVFLGRRQ